MPIPAEPAPPPDDLWDANDVARYLKVSRSWVYYRAEAGLLPCIRLGALVRFDPAVVRAFARGEIQPQKAPASPGSPTGKNR
jgi:excisionase family DNA binding protein